MAVDPQLYKVQLTPPGTLNLNAGLLDLGNAHVLTLMLHAQVIPKLGEKIFGLVLRDPGFKRIKLSKMKGFA